MKIAVSTNGKDMDSRIDERFSMSQFLLIFNIDDVTLEGRVEKSFNCDMDETQLAQIILQEDCEAIISGIIDGEAFRILADNCVTRFNGIGLTAEDAIHRMNVNALDLFRHAEDEDDDCSSHDYGGSHEEHGHGSLN